jgi:hypothetical protein
MRTHLHISTLTQHGISDIPCTSMTALHLAFRNYVRLSTVRLLAHRPETNETLLLIIIIIIIIIVVIE